MKHLFVISNSEMCTVEYMHTGHTPIVHRRSVLLELSPEQEKQLAIQQVGAERTRPIMETIDSISPLMETEYQ